MTTLLLEPPKEQKKVFRGFSRSPKFAILCAVCTALLVGVLPFLLLQYFDHTRVVPYGIDLNIYALKNLLILSIIFSPFMTVLAFMANYYSPVEKKSLIFRMAQILVSIAYILLLTNFGRMERVATMSFNGITIDVGLTLTMAVILLIAIKIIQLEVFYNDYLDCKHIEEENDTTPKKIERVRRRFE